MQPDALLWMFVDKSRGTMNMYAAGLKPAGEGKAYELWVINDKGDKLPCGVFNVNSHGQAAAERPIPPEMGKLMAVAVTVERAEGALTPTMPIQVLGKVQ